MAARTLFSSIHIPSAADVKEAIADNTPLPEDPSRDKLSNVFNRMVQEVSAVTGSGMIVADMVGNELAASINDNVEREDFSYRLQTWTSSVKNKAKEIPAPTPSVSGKLRAATVRMAPLVAGKITIDASRRRMIQKKRLEEKAPRRGSYRLLWTNRERPTQWVQLHTIIGHFDSDESSDLSEAETDSLSLGARLYDYALASLVRLSGTATPKDDYLSDHTILRAMPDNPGPISIDGVDFVQNIHDTCTIMMDQQNDHQLTIAIFRGIDPTIDPTVLLARYYTPIVALCRRLMAVVSSIKEVDIQIQRLQPPGDGFANRMVYKKAEMYAVMATLYAQLHYWMRYSGCSDAIFRQIQTEYKRSLTNCCVQLAKWGGDTDVVGLMADAFVGNILDTEEARAIRDAQVTPLVCMAYLFGPSDELALPSTSKRVTFKGERIKDAVNSVLVQSSIGAPFGRYHMARYYLYMKAHDNDKGRDLQLFKALVSVH